MLPEMKFLAENYEPEVWWSDGDPALPEYWGSQEFMAWLFNHSPKKDTIVTNDRFYADDRNFKFQLVRILFKLNMFPSNFIRWGSGTSQKHGSFFSGPDRFKPGHILPHKYESAFTIDSVSWGYRRNMNIEDILSVEDIIGQIVETVSCNGNVLINVGPTKEGTICPIFQERMTQMGQWLGVNGEAIYGTRPFKHQNDSISTHPQVWYTQKSDAVYAIALGWPKNEVLSLGDIVPNAQTQINLLGYNDQALSFTNKHNVVEITFPNMRMFLESCGLHCLPAFALKITNVRPREQFEEIDIRLEIVKREPRN